MSLFSAIKAAAFGAAYSVIDTFTITADEAKSIRSAKVVMSKGSADGKVPPMPQVVFHFVEGGYKSVTLSTDSKIGVGEEFPVVGSKVLTLDNGERECQRIIEG